MSTVDAIPPVRISLIASRSRRNEWNGDGEEEEEKDKIFILTIADESADQVL